MRLHPSLALILVPFLSTAAMAQNGSDSCAVADILFGPRSLDILPYQGDGYSYETAIVRHSSFDSDTYNFGAILGEISVDRGSFAVRNLNQVVVGIITPDLKIEGWDDLCDEGSVAEFVEVRDGNYMTFNGDSAVGRLEGRFPENDFGVK